MAASDTRTSGPDEAELVITRVFDAPRALVFKAWTQPEHLVRWWGPGGFTTPHANRTAVNGVRGPHRAPKRRIHAKPPPWPKHGSRPAPA